MEIDRSGPRQHIQNHLLSCLHSNIFPFIPFTDIIFCISTLTYILLMLATDACMALLSLLLDVTYWSGVYAADSFLSDHLIRKDPVQNVLEHQPATKPACEHQVRISSI